jgi:hypothetical protein
MFPIFWPKFVVGPKIILEVLCGENPLLCWFWWEDSRDELGGLMEYVGGRMFP